MLICWNAEEAHSQRKVGSPFFIQTCLQWLMYNCSKSLMEATATWVLIYILCCQLSCSHSLACKSAQRVEKLFLIKIGIFSRDQIMHRHADMAMLPRYHISKILPIYLSNMCSLKLLRYCSARSVRKPKLLLHLWLINGNFMSCFLWHAAFQLHQVVHNISTAAQSSQ